MPPLSASEVRRIAALARLELSDREVERFTTELAAILEYAAQVQQIDTPRQNQNQNPNEHPNRGTEPPNSRTAEPSNRSGATRPDSPEPSLPRQVVLDEAPGADPAAGFFTVPRVLGA